MKNKLYLALLAVSVSVVFAACGSKTARSDLNDQQTEESMKTDEEDGESQDAESGRYLKDIDASDYVTLGNYEGIEIAINEPEVTEEMLEDYIAYI